MFIRVKELENEYEITYFNDSDSFAEYIPKENAKDQLAVYRGAMAELETLINSPEKDKKTEENTEEGK